MIQRLLSLFKTYPDYYCSLSESGKQYNYNIGFNNYFYAHRMLLIGTIGWIIYQLYTYTFISLRPQELFVQIHYFGKLFMPFFPSLMMSYSVGILSIFLILYLLVYKESIILRAILAFAIAWINLLKWSFGGQSHVGHLLILAHLFSIFIPTTKNIADNNKVAIHKSIEWYYLGLLMTYTYSGFWKWIALIYKLFKKGEISWLNPNAALYNSLIGYHESELPLENIPKFFTFPLFWQLSFLFMIFVLTFSFLAAFRKPLRVWIALLLIIFHIVNNLAFNVEFYTPLWVIFFLFFPYDKLFRINNGLIVNDSSWTGRLNHAIYTRYYENGDKDIFYGFYAYREEMVDINWLIGGLLHFPFLDLLIIGIWKIAGGTKVKPSPRSY